MGCCDSFCKVSLNHIIKKQNEQLEENLSQKIFIEENTNINKNNKNILLVNSLPVQEQIQVQNPESKLDNNKLDKNAKNSSEYTFKNNNFIQNNINNENIINENKNEDIINNENKNNPIINEDINDINNYLSNENNNNINNNINVKIPTNLQEKEKEEKEEKSKKIMDRINKGRKQAQNKNEGNNNYKKSDKIQNFANQLEKVMFPKIE